MEYISYFLIIVALFTAIVFFRNRIVDKRIWILFVFIYANVFFLPILLSFNKLIAANSNGIIAFLLLFFCLINLNEKNIVLRSLNIYTTILLVITLFTATSRTAMMAFFIAIFVFFTIKYLHKYTFLILSSLILLSPTATGIYVYLKHTSIGTTLNNLTIEVTGKPFFSGRDTIWSEALDQVLQNGKFWTGLGNNTEFQNWRVFTTSMCKFFTNQALSVSYWSASLFFSFAISRTRTIDLIPVLVGYFIAILFCRYLKAILL
jgi:hypothetical protein